MDRSSIATLNHGGSKLRVAYQGVPGAFSEAAALKAYLNYNPLLLPCKQFETAFHAVEKSIADHAVLPLENSLGGSVHKNYDLLLLHRRLHIVGEIHLHVHHCLVALPGTRIDDVARVISHAQALSQCERTLTKLLPAAATREAVENTAAAAKMIADDNLHETAAVASGRAAEIYGLEVVADGVQDDSRNVTRFVILGRQPVVPLQENWRPDDDDDGDCRFKTSIVFAAKENGNNGDILFKVMSAFVSRNIRVTKIEPRPYRDRPVRDDGNGNGGRRKYFDYVFYVDFEASLVDVSAQDALADVREYTTFLRVLGSYPTENEKLLDTTQPSCGT